MAEHNNRVAENRAARLEAANRHEEAMRAAAAAKVQAVEDRLVRFEAERADHAVVERQRIATVEARREAAYRNNLQLLEERRQEILTKERKVEDMLRQRDELRQLQAQIKAEEDYLREHQRRATKARAEGELADRVAHFHAKSAAKDELTTRRKQALDNLRRMRAEELRQRFDYIAAQANEAAAVAEAERQALAERLEDKTARGEALAAQRAALLAEMQNLRFQMQRQEEVLRGSLLRMRQTGSVALPEEVVRSLEGLQIAGPVMATAVLGGGRAPLMLEGPPDVVDGGVVAAVAQGQAPTQPATQVGGADAARSQGHVARGGYSGGRVYMSSMISPRVGQMGKTARRLAGEMRPLSAGADARRANGAASTAASPATPVGQSTGAGAGPSPYAPYTMPTARSRARQPTVEEQVAEATNTADQAAEAAASGRYTGVHEVARPGSRREEELRVVLQEEIAKESERQSMLTQVTDEAERTRLVKYFTLEREEAKRRILALSNAAQAALYH